ncbi:DUF2188 domain-containing protein [Halobacillus litoralis]|uniref:DUF2188 domain-containing protein n=1 Tax=Halobacillus litoralis TaxID=45668 RepID=A0A845DXZ4_9BACI|nr:DUF2188 domain-containing protein [Halobacillus litoralis]MCA1022303.1 DUF2188 domain-containing protein [Halobacillus litoralis]MYL21325.1 DUF2188 domain-containing protein [Halobacillus litoralis]MYL30231.1 DUF2188 domain-containing protein [Halobacillus halophilus]MYL38222.1 DUF2188 domain-containing protein [Halobacillus litoralis]
MAESNNQAEHVVPHEDGWAVKAEGAEQPTKIYENKQDAIDRAKEIAQNKGTSAIIHTEKGTIQNQYNYSS